jgi:hypothetical protein
MDTMLQLIELPFIALWRVLGVLLGATGRLVAFVFGLLLLIVGGLLTLTVIGGFVGVPLMLVGLVLVIRAFF